MSKGAKLCGVTQSAASQHVQEVERRLGAPLLDRAKRPLELTPAGLTGAYPGIQEEKRAIVEAGLASSPWQHMDDTGTRVDGENQHCQILCNPLYGAYFTTAHKDRLSIIDVLRNGRQRVFRLNEEAWDLVRRFGVSKRVAEQLGQLPFHQDWSEEELQRRLAEQIPDLSEGTRRRMMEAAA